MSSVRRTVALAALLAVLSCTAPSDPSARATASSPSVAVSAPATSAPPPSATAATSQQPTPDPTAPPRAVPVRVTALGALRGDWIFFGKHVPEQTSTGQRTVDVEIWAVPVSGGAPIRAISYTLAVSPIESFGDTTPNLRRQFSPDGTQLVLAAGNELLIVDLASGRTRALGIEGYSPSWSRDGTRIAYAAPKSPSSWIGDGRTWIVPVGGGPSIQIPGEDGVYARPLEWSPDSAKLLVGEMSGVALYDVASLRVERRFGADLAPGPWRAATPQIVMTRGAFASGGRSQVRLFDSATTPERIVADGSSLEITYAEPRWNPARPNELLYLQNTWMPGPHRSAIEILDVATMKTTELPYSAVLATWLWDGEHIVYLSGMEGSISTAVRIASRNGGPERELMTASGNEAFFSVASLRY